MRLLLLFVAHLLVLPFAQCDVQALWDFSSSFSFRDEHDLTPLLSANLTSHLTGFNSHGTLVKRAEECVDPGYVPCSNVDACCPAGDTCFPTGCCPGGYELCGSSHCYDPSSSTCCDDGATSCPTGYDCVDGGCCPSGEELCGSYKCYNPKNNICCEKGSAVWGCTLSQKCCSDDYCYDSDSQQCCDNGACLSQDSCCTYECCKSIAYCGGDGFCSLCPAATETTAITLDTTYSLTITRSVLEVCEAEDASGFSCVPMTVTNDEGATLELDTDCALSYSPAATTTGSSAEVFARAAPVTIPPELRRAVSCVPYTTVTETLTSDDFVTSRTTTTTTVCTEPTDFSCVPMSVTNSAGDELSLDDECKLELSLAEPSTTTSSVAGAGASSTASTLSEASRGKPHNALAIIGAVSCLIFLA